MVLQNGLNRRHFLAGTLACAAAVAEKCSPVESAENTENETPHPLVDTPPVLQTPAETSMGIAWGVHGPVGGFVQISADERTLAEAGRIAAGRMPLKGIEDRVLSVQVEGLSPGTTYFYRTGTFSVAYPNAYNVTTG